jgi:rhodanese-related sulfurtransferase
MDVVRIRAEDVYERMNRGEPVQFIDARDHDAWHSSDRKLPGAIRVPAGDVDDACSELPRGAVVVAYCNGPGERSSARVAQRLSELGFPDVFALTGGFDAWVGHALPLEMKSGVMLNAPAP